MFVQKPAVAMESDQVKSMESLSLPQSSDVNLREEDEEETLCITQVVSKDIAYRYTECEEDKEEITIEVLDDKEKVWTSDYQGFVYVSGIPHTYTYEVQNQKHEMYYYWGQTLLSGWIATKLRLSSPDLGMKTSDASYQCGCLK